MERHLAEAKLLPGKTLDTFDFDAVPMISKAQVMAICAGDSWLENGANLILFGPPGGGKSHLSSGIGLALIEKGWRVLRSEEHTSELQSLMRISYAVFCLKKKKKQTTTNRSFDKQFTSRITKQNI